MKRVLNSIYFLAITILVIAIFVSLSPKGIFSNTLTAGGDTGAHVWWPHFYVNNFFSRLKLFGWSMDYFAGFPAGQFYFPVPVLMMAFLNIIMPIDVAFKIVTVFGALLMPFSAGFFVKSIGPSKAAGKYIQNYLMPFAAAMAVVVMQFFSGDGRIATDAMKKAGLDFQNVAFNQRIMGGILPSTLAGEFSFTIAMAFMFFSLGYLVKYFKGEKNFYLPVIFGALTLGSHLVVGIALIYCSFTAFIIYMIIKDKKNLLSYGLFYLAILLSLSNIFKLLLDQEVNLTTLISLVPLLAILVLMILDKKDIVIKKYFIFNIFSLGIVSIWLLPLLKNFGYTSTMRYAKIEDVFTTKVNELFELYLFPSFAWWVMLGVFLFIATYALLIYKKGFKVVKYYPELLYLFTLTLISLIFFVFWPESHAWNIRFLPFYYFFVMMLSFCGYAFFIQNLLKLNLLKSRVYPIVAFLLIASTLGCLLLTFGVGQENKTLKDRRGVIPFWAEWNYEGYQNKDSWNEFEYIMKELNTLPKGRLFWERTTEIDHYGSAIALDLIPYFTDGKISSMEGLYFEASGTTAYHFLTAGSLASEPSNPMRWPECGYDEVDDGLSGAKCQTVAYPDNNTQEDFNSGVQKLQQLGVNYYMATSEKMNNFAINNENLDLKLTIKDKDGQGPSGWKVYSVKNSDLIQPLTQTPLVVKDSDNKKSWTQTGNTWLVNLFNNNIIAVADSSNVKEATANQANPNQSWETITKSEARNLALTPKPSQKQKYPKVKVSNLKISNNKVSFKVDRVGVPVLIKVSYYPNWKSVGASQPIRVSPNFMLVTPNQKDVQLVYSTTSIERIGWAITWFSLVLMLFLFISSKYPLYRYLKRNKHKE